MAIRTSPQPILSAALIRRRPRPLLLAPTVPCAPPPATSVGDDWAGTLRFFLTCYAAGLVFFLIMLS